MLIGVFLVQILSRGAGRPVSGRVRVGPEAHAPAGRHVDQAAATVCAHPDTWSVRRIGTIQLKCNQSGQHYKPACSIGRPQKTATVWTTSSA